MKLNSSLTKLILPILLVLALSSCSKRSDKELGITFVDSSNVYSKHFKEKVTNNRFHFPNGIPVLIITTDSIPDPEIGEFANTQLDSSSKWIKSKTDRENCLLIVVSKSPRLIQIRYGENLRLEAYKAGLSLGSQYRQYQEIFLKKGNKDGLLAVLDSLQKELPGALDLSWIMKLQKPEVKTVFNELSELATPSGNDYTKFVFKPYSHLITSIKLFSHPLLLIAFNALILFLVVKIGKAVIIKLFGSNKVTYVILIIWNFISSIFFTIPYWGSIIFLSSLRMEDSIYAQHLEIPLLKNEVYSDSLSSYTPFWFAITIGIIVFFIEFQNYYFSAIGINWLFSSQKETIDKVKLEDSEHSEVFNRASGRAITIGFFTLFMPIIISLLILFYNLIKIPSSISGYKKLSKMNVL